MGGGRLVFSFLSKLYLRGGGIHKTLHSLVASSLSVLEVAADWDTDGDGEDDSTTDGDEDDVDGLQLLGRAGEILVSAVARAVTISAIIRWAASVTSAVVGATETSEDLESVVVRGLQWLDGDDPAYEVVVKALNIEEVDLSSLIRSDFVRSSGWDAGGGSVDARGTSRSVRSTNNTDQQPGGLISEVSDSSRGG